MAEGALHRFIEANRRFERVRSEADSLERIRDEALLAVQHELRLTVAEMSAQTGLSTSRIELILDRARLATRD